MRSRFIFTTLSLFLYLPGCTKSETVKDVAAIEPLVRKALQLPKARPKPVVVEEAAVDSKKSETVSTEVTTLPTETATAESRSVVESDERYSATPTFTQSPVLVSAYASAPAESYESAVVESEALGVNAPTDAEESHSSPSFLANVGRYFSAPATAPTAAGGASSSESPGSEVAATAASSPAADVIQDSGTPTSIVVATTPIVSAVEARHSPRDLGLRGRAASGQLMVPAQQVHLSLSSDPRENKRLPSDWRTIGINCTDASQNKKGNGATTCTIPQLVNLDEAQFRLALFVSEESEVPIEQRPEPPPIEVEFRGEETLLRWEPLPGTMTAAFRVVMDPPVGLVDEEGAPIRRLIYERVFLEKGGRDEDSPKE